LHEQPRERVAENLMRAVVGGQGRTGPPGGGGWWVLTLRCLASSAAFAAYDMVFYSYLTLISMVLYGYLQLIFMVLYGYLQLIFMVLYGYLQLISMVLYGFGLRSSWLATAWSQLDDETLCSDDFVHCLKRQLALAVEEV